MRRQSKSQFFSKIFSMTRPMINHRKLVFLVLASANQEHALDEYTQRKTWASDPTFDYDVFWIRGDSSRQFQLIDRTLWVPCADSEILKKTILAVTWLTSNLSFDYVIRTNVSTYFQPSKMYERLRRIKYGDFFGGYVEKVGKNNSSFSELSFVSGAGLFFPIQTSRKLTKLPLSSYLHWPDDVAISHFLLSQNIPLIPFTRSNLGYHYVPFLNSYTRCKTSHKPKMASIRMEYLHNSYNSRRYLEKFTYLLKLLRQEFANVNYEKIYIAGYFRNAITCVRRYFKFVFCAR